MLKKWNLGSQQLDISKIYKKPEWGPLPLPPQQDPDQSTNPFLNLWNIKHPTLRGYRYKVMVKDVFSNERRFRFQLSESPFCCHCLAVETVEHQLLECANAQRMWQLYAALTGVDITITQDIILCSPNITHEVLKSVIIKRLLQIDRSVNQNDKSIVAECLFYLNLELLACSKINLPQSHPLFTLITTCKQYLIER